MEYVKYNAKLVLMLLINVQNVLLIEFIHLYADVKMAHLKLQEKLTVQNVMTIA